MVDLHADLVEMIWVIMAYILVSTVFLLTFGRIADMFGRVRMYNLGFVVFTIGSALCGLAGNASTLIGFRLVQGAGAAMLPGSFVLPAFSADKPAIGTWPEGSKGDTVNVGAAVPRTGTYAVQGEDELKGWQLAVELREDHVEVDGGRGLGHHDHDDVGDPPAGENQLAHLVQRGRRRAPAPGSHPGRRPGPGGSPGR